MPDDVVVAGSQASLPLGGEGAGSAGIDWSKGGVEHFGKFKESLGDIGKDKSLEPIKDFHGLTKSFVDAQKMIGSSIRLPAKDAKPEDRDKAVKDILGKLRANGVLESVPESPDKYEIKTPSSEELPLDEPLFNSFKQWAHARQLTSSQAQGLFDDFLRYQEGLGVKREEEIVQIQLALKKELGGLHTTHMERARRASAHIFGVKGDELIRKITYNEVKAEDMKHIVMSLARAGEHLAEDTLTIGGIPGVVTKEQVKAKIDAMFNDKTHALNDVSHRQHKEAVQEYLPPPRPAPAP